MKVVWHWKETICYKCIGVLVGAISEKLLSISTSGCTSRATATAAPGEWMLFWRQLLSHPWWFTKNLLYSQATRKTKLESREKADDTWFKERWLTNGTLLHDISSCQSCSRYRKYVSTRQRQIQCCVSSRHAKIETLQLCLRDFWPSRYVHLENAY